MANNQAALMQFAAGTFVPSPTTGKQSAKFTNQLLIPVHVTPIRSSGTLNTGKQLELDPGKPSPQLDGNDKPNVGDAWLVQAAETGALINVLVIEDGKEEYKIKADDLPNPNLFGTGLRPSSSNPTASNGAVFLVGQGGEKNDRVITRERWWNLTDQTVSLSPGESRNWEIVTSEGVEDSTRTLTEVAAELGMKAEAGWGPISSEVSSSLSTSSSVGQTVTLTSSKSSKETRLVSNTDGKGDKTIQVWQLQERYSIWKFKSGKPLKAQIINDTNDTVTVTRFSRA